jgi:oligoribonuclease NrnB/cAMP/cGMP phosphodiesterase (DHH superfamily)
MSILVIADTDLDGTGSAVLITKYYEMFYGSSIPFKKGTQVEVMFPSRKSLDDLFSDAIWCEDIKAKYEHIYLCDTCPNSLKACENIGTILAPKMTIFDHHSTNLDRLEQYVQNFTDASGWCGLNIIEGERCSAKITFDVLREMSRASDKFNVFKKFAGLVNDYDLWYRMFPRSTDLADYVATVGADRAYQTLLQIADDPDKNVEEMETLIAGVRKEKEKSLDLAYATLVKHKGYKTPFYTCMVDDWASWVGSEVVAKTGLVAMFDIRRKSLSFRVGSKYVGTEWHKVTGIKPNALDFAEPLGGGGHPQAAGVSTGEASPIFKQLSERLGEILLETYNERSRSTT